MMGTGALRQAQGDNAARSGWPGVLRGVLAEGYVEALFGDSGVAGDSVVPVELGVAGHHDEVAVFDVDLDRVVAETAVFFGAQLEAAGGAERERCDDEPCVARAVA